MIDYNQDPTLGKIETGFTKLFNAQVLLLIFLKEQDKQQLGLMFLVWQKASNEYREAVSKAMVQWEKEFNVNPGFDFATNPDE